MARIAEFTSDEERRKYQVVRSLNGYWMGKCPDCSERIRNTNKSYSIRILIHEINKHQKEVHNATTN